MEEENNELEENFLSRWSKKKSKQKTQIENFNSKQIDSESSTETENQSSLVEENDKLNDEELLKKYNLPNPEKIKTEKSLDVFFKEGVPDRLRQIALRRVWRLNPIIRFADAEINDYHEDFTDAATVIEGMETAYKVGKGYLTDLIDNKDKKDEDESLVSKEISSLKKDKKKIKKISKAKNIDKTQNAKSKQTSDEVKKNDIKKVNQIKEPDSSNEQNSTRMQESPDFSEHIKQKIKPENMVFKPKANDNDYY